jgi:ribose transport system substrate-binding protein
VPDRRHFLLSLPLLASCAHSRRNLIAVVPKAVSHLFFVAVHAGVKRAARESGVEILWNGPNDETDHSRQIQIVEAMISRRVSALAISATDERALSATVERVIQAGIPVTIFDSGVNVDGYVSFVATDNYGAGATAARELARLCGGKGDIGMVMHKPGGTSTMLREQGFQETIAKEFPGIKIAAHQYGFADRARARGAAENILTAHPNIAGIFASSEASSLGAIQAISTRGLSGKLKLITFDTSESHVEALKNGTIDIMLVQDSFRIGYEAVKSLADKLQGRTPERRMDLPARVIRKADLNKPDVQSLVKPQTAAIEAMHRTIYFS